MKINIAVTDNKLLAPLYHNADVASAKFDINLVKLKEEQVAELLYNNRIQIALISPLSYGKGILKGDFRVVPGPALTAESYTGMASIFFNQGLKTIDSAASPYPDDFLMTIGSKLLSEKYNTYVDLKKKEGSAIEILKEYDAALVYEMSSMTDAALDVTEEWYFYNEQQLPLAFWVVRAEEYPENVSEIINALAMEDILLNKEEFYNPDDERSGKIYWEFDKRFEDAGDNLLEFLYYHQFFPESPSIKFADLDD